MGKTYQRHKARTVSRADRLRRMNQDKNTRIITKYIAGTLARLPEGEDHDVSTSDFEGSNRRARS
jgi:hypothetical protein